MTYAISSTNDTSGNPSLGIFLGDKMLLAGFGLPMNVNADAC
jgi:hypothetical protein